MMDVFKNVTLYKKQPIEGTLFNYLFFKDDRGRDWYDTRVSWKAAVAVNESGLVCAFEHDVSRMTMVEGQTVYEIIPGNVPDSVVGNYSYNGIEFNDVRPDASVVAMQEKNEKMQSATLQISVLQDAIRLDMASDSDAELLKSWETYRVLLHKVDVSNAPEIDWPEMPV